MSGRLSRIGEGGAKELKAEFERKVERFDDVLNLLPVSNVHILDMVAVCGGQC